MNIDLTLIPVLPEESFFENTDHDEKDLKRRRQVLRDTISVLTEKYAYLHQKAATNLEKWSKNPLCDLNNSDKCMVSVIKGDWGEVTKELTKKHGKCFAVLNMANADAPGGGYRSGLAAQEENMFRRTDCHFTLNVNDLENGRYYKKEMSDLVNGVHGVVYLDTKRPRICIRGHEKRDQEDLGYEWLTEDEIFPFYEMRSAAIDLGLGISFSEEECMKKIKAQFNTLKNSGIKYVVLGAHGCGAFLNPPKKVAEIYKKVIDEYKNDFNIISFAIFSAGYGPDNYTIFKNILEANKNE